MQSIQGSYRYSHQVPHKKNHAQSEIDRTTIQAKSRYKYERRISCSGTTKIIAGTLAVFVLGAFIANEIKKAEQRHQSNSAKKSVSSAAELSVSTRVNSTAGSALTQSESTSVSASVPTKSPESSAAPFVKTNRDAGELEAFYKKNNLDPNPQLPEKSYSMDKEKAQLWIDAHKEDEERRVAAKFIEVTRHVTQEEFESHLKHSVGQFEEWYLPLRNELNKFVLVTTDSSKSNHWVASLAVKYFKQLPDDVIYVYQAAEYAKNHPGVNTFVLFDDAAYSCLQSNEMLENLNKNIHHTRLSSEQGINYSLVSIIPFVRAPNCMAPKNTSNFKSFYSEIMKPLKEFFNKEEMKSFYKIYDMSGENRDSLLENRFPLYFDFKIADAWSTFTKIYDQGLISCSLVEQVKIPFIDKITPPYKLKRCLDRGYSKKVCLDHSYLMA